MKKAIFLLVITSILLSACSIPNKTPDITDAATAKLVNPMSSKPVLLSQKFNPEDPAVYFSLKVTDFPAGTKLRALWRYLDSGTEMSSEITAEGTGYQVFTLKRSSAPFPAGRYEVTATAVINGKTLQAKSEFSIASNTEPPHLFNPVTSKSISSDDKLGPVDATAEFSISDSIIYFVIQSKELPEDTKVSCKWIHIDSDETLVHEITTDGSRNIVFSLKPDDSQKLPEGKYIVIASAEINGSAESVWAEFEVRK